MSITIPTCIHAISFAARWHDGQYRKDGKTPYIAHPLRVAILIRDMFNISDPLVLTAAVLHDVVEDTKCSLAQIDMEFGSVVHGVVGTLTKRCGESYQDYCYRITTGGKIACIIKVADACDNLMDSVGTSFEAKTVEKANMVLGSAGQYAPYSAYSQLKHLLEGK